MRVTVSKFDHHSKGVKKARAEAIWKAVGLSIEDGCHSDVRQHKTNDITYPGGQDCKMLELATIPHLLVAL